MVSCQSDILTKSCFIFQTKIESRQDISTQNWKVGDLAADFLLEYGIVVSPIVENRDYFIRNMNVLPFYRNIAREGVSLSA